MATETGGKFYHAPDADELRRLYQSLSIEIQKEYVLTYRSPRPTYDGTRRNIVVTIERGGGAPAVTAGGGYLEQHLINIRSNGVIGLILFLPLLVALILPAAVAKAQGRRLAKGTEGVEGAEGVCPHRHQAKRP
jgi:hypothetical protein